MKKDPLDPKEVKTTCFEISVDELEARMERQRKMRTEPVQQAVALLDAALEKVLTKLGVDVNTEPEVIKAQQEFLGITIGEHTDERMPQLNGFFIYVGYSEFIPYAWVGAVRLDSTGQCLCDIQWFQDNRLDEMGGGRLIT